jgi:predicted regulator of Ras-like GTPase activity (Roadblock/LC7/MglB family)
MTVPFLDLFKKAKARVLATIAPSTPRPSLPLPFEKPSGESLRKTVVPKTKRTPAAPEPPPAASTAPAVAKSPPVPAPRMISINPTPAAMRSRELPPALAFALQPKIERTISLQLSDIIEQVPPGYVKPADMLDTTRRVCLKASEVEKAIASGEPSVSLASIHQQAPDIFVRSLAASDATRIPLPREKVLQQLNNLRVRPDQVREQAVPQVDTPILKVTLEDTERFGTTIAPLQTSPLPPVKVEPATAQTIAAAEPEAAIQETVKSTSPERPAIALDAPVAAQPAPKSASAVEPVMPAKKIPFLLPPNGTGVPASERVPASSGPPVPTTSPPPPAPSPVGTKINAPGEELHLKPAFQPPDEAVCSVAPLTSVRKPKEEKAKIALALRPILEELPPFQLNGNPGTVPADVRLEFPLSLIEPQLAAGRVAVSPKAFQEAMPEVYRGLFEVDLAQTPVSLPLEEVLKNLPATVLRLRDDQEQIELSETFETSFSLKAQEDAKRFNVSPAPIAKVSDKPAEPLPTDKKIEIEPEARIDAKQVVARTSGFAGVAGCAITFADGLSLAGNLPAELGAEGLCAMAPSLLQKIDKHMTDTKLGLPRALTLHCVKKSVTFFVHGNIYLTALHANGELSAETREQIASMVRELSRTYAQPEAAHVDH